MIVIPHHLVAPLAEVATRAIAIKLMDGKHIDSAWAGVAGQIAGIIAGACSSQDSGVDELGRKVDDIGRKVDAIPTREFAQHMDAGCRHLRDLPVSWRTRQDRRDLIRDARGEFVRASAIAKHMGDIQRQMTAELAIVGCWLWVPSMQDVTNTLDEARLTVERELLFRAVGAFSATSSTYRDIVTLCKAYRVPATINAGSLIVPSDESSPIPGARVAVRGVHGKRVWCAGIELMTYPDNRPPRLRDKVLESLHENEDALESLDRASQRLRENKDADYTLLAAALAKLTDYARQKARDYEPLAPLAPDDVPALVSNQLDRWISVANSSDSVFMHIFERSPDPPLGFHVAPGTQQKFNLRFIDRSAMHGSNIPLTPTVGFLMPSRELTA